MHKKLPQIAVIAILLYQNIQIRKTKKANEEYALFMFL